MNDFEENVDECLEDEPQLEPERVGEYLGERNALGERHGKGWAILPNGDQYDGSYRKGIRNGHGLYVFKNGARYLGNYRCGIRHGFGKFIYPDGTFYEGNWNKNQKHGQGTYTYANGDTYSGAWYKGKRHGVGIYKWKDLGVYFEGTWKGGIRVGPCVVQYPKFMFHGWWDYKYPQGPGVFSFDDKHMLHGYYKSESLFKSKEVTTCEKKLDNNLQEIYNEENDDEEEKVIDGEGEEISQVDLDVKPTIWVSQNMTAFDYSLLPQHPVPLPIDDSEVSICDLDSVKMSSSDLEGNSLEPSIIAKQEEEGSAEVVLEEGESQSETECDFDNTLTNI
ncbi:radial spoke head 1 homolog [Episyrphus balteatus]|uniref:radial spoke head 1 homolog n=1 Tax=Episyrphus balteatus TaxID=286459 RepID=UPI0024858640|nr:radial spoke head 1 homolog [Episyrphus balteatus]